MTRSHDDQSSRALATCSRTYTIYLVVFSLRVDSLDVGNNVCVKSLINKIHTQLSNVIMNDIPCVESCPGI